jgi:putative membrane protein
MKTWIVRVVINACALAVAAWLFTGIVVNGASNGDRVLTLLVVALIFGVVNEIVRPVVSLLSIPLYVLTLGLFYFVVNALMLWLTSWVCDLIGIGFRVHGFWTAVFGAVVISVVSWVMGMVLPAEKTPTWRRVVSRR